MLREGSIAIRGAGMHAYMWGNVRFSVCLALILWLIISIGLELWTLYFRFFDALAIISAGATLIYGSGRLLTAKHPFFPEIVSCWAWRTLRRAYSLDS